jgi:3-oxoacyl-[acyl-carrier protein] reductase
MITSDLQGKAVLVTGASRGIGAAIAQAFAAQGASVAVNFLKDSGAAQQVVDACVKAGGDAVALQADVTVPEQATSLVARTIEAFGRLDVLVNNAFAPYAFDPERRTTFGALAWPDYLRQFEGSVGAAFHMCHAALPHLRARAQGAIVNIASDLVEDPVVPYHDYGTAKSALVGFSRQLAAELGPQGVRVNCVAPGLVHPTAGSAGTRASFRESIMAATPLRRLARPEDVAGPVVFLASAASAFITGQVLLVDGGRVMR